MIGEVEEKLHITVSQQQGRNCRLLAVIRALACNLSVISDLLFFLFLHGAAGKRSPLPPVYRVSASCCIYLTEGQYGTSVPRPRRRRQNGDTHTHTHITWLGLEIIIQRVTVTEEMSVSGRLIAMISLSLPATRNLWGILQCYCSERCYHADKCEGQFA